MSKATGGAGRSGKEAEHFLGMMADWPQAGKARKESFVGYREWWQGQGQETARKEP